MDAAATPDQAKVILIAPASIGVRATSTPAEATFVPSIEVVPLQAEVTPKA